MTKALQGRKVAALVANGFSEKDLIAMQKGIIAGGGDVRVISMDQGLVNSWNEGDGQWGLNFAVDSKLSEALAADFDMLIVPGGKRSMQKLQLTAHTRRFIGGFIDSGKPAVFMDKGLELLLFSERAEGLNIAGPEVYEQAVSEAGATYSDAAVYADGAVFTGHSRAETRDTFVAQAIAFLNDENVDTVEAVAA